MQQTKVFDYYLANDPLKHVLMHEDRARLLSMVEVRHYGIDDIIYAPKHEAQYLYFITEGAVTLATDDHHALTLKAGSYFGEESVLESTCYSAKATSREPTTIIAFPKENFLSVMDFRLDLRPFFMGSFLDKLPQRTDGEGKAKKNQASLRKEVPSGHTHHLAARHKSDSCAGGDASPSIRFCAAWTLATILPLLAYYLLDDLALDTNSRLYLSILTGALTLWLFDVLPAYVPGLFLVVAPMALNILSTKTILSSFCAPPVVMALSFFVIGGVIVSSGLLYRLMLLVLKYIPPTQFWLNSSVFFLGTLLTAILPSPGKRAKVFAHFVEDISRNTGWSPPERAHQRLLLTAYHSVTLLGPVFLSGTVYGFFLYGLLSPQDQERFQWTGWFSAAFFPMVLLIVAFFMLQFFLLPSTEKPLIDRDRIEAQLKALGPVQTIEQGAIWSFSLVILGIMTAPLHRMSQLAVLLGVVFVLMIFKQISTGPLKRHVDWDALLTLGAFFSLVFGLQTLNLTPMMLTTLDTVGDWMEREPFLFFLSILFTGGLTRFWVPYSIFTPLALIVFIPLAIAHGMNPWPVGFVILMAGESWFNPKTYPPFERFFQNFQGHFNEEKEWGPVQFNGLMMLLRWGVVFIAMPYWRSIGLL